MKSISLLLRSIRHRLRVWRRKFASQRSRTELFGGFPELLQRPPDGVREIRQVLDRWRASLPDR